MDTECILDIEELVKSQKSKNKFFTEEWLLGRVVSKVSSPFETLSSSAPTVRLFAVADEKISELEKLVEQLRGELGKEKKTICQLLSDGHVARLGADKKIADLVKSQDNLEKIITQKHRESVSQAERIDKLERIVAQKDKKIKELEKDPSDAELDIRAKEGSKKHAEAKAKLQKLYDERPIISLMDGESIGDLLVNKMISDLIISM
jgi:flagellar biosynthesis/type III secretory pathway ATPase